MGISERRLQHAVVLDLTGPLTGRQTAAAIDTAVRRQAKAGARIVVANLGRVPLVDLAGLGALVDAYITMREARGTFRLACLTKRIHDLVVITRLLTIIDTFNSVEAAAGEAVADSDVSADGRFSLMALMPIQRFLNRV